VNIPPKFQNTQNKKHLGGTGILDDFLVCRRVNGAVMGSSNPQAEPTREYFSEGV